MKRIIATICMLAICAVALARPEDYSFARDIGYRQGTDCAKCLLDVAHCVGATDRPVIVWFHGGGLVGGHRDMPRESQGIGPLTPIIDDLAPLRHVRGDAAPFLVISGDREKELYGRYEETAYFVRMLKLCGHKDVTFYELDGFDHGGMARPGHALFMSYIRERESK